jgi:hypothetical protein
LPWPNFTFQNITFSKKNKNIANIERMKIFVSPRNFFFPKKIKFKNIIIENSNFNLNKDNYNFFIQFLDNDFFELDFEIINSNVFYRNIEKEVLLINKINFLRYYYDTKEFRNILIAENEIFNIPYALKLRNDNKKKKLFSKLNLNSLKLQIENELNYSNDKKYGLMNLIYQKNKSEINYTVDKEYFTFNFFDKSINQSFNYKSKINFSPFYFYTSGKIDQLNLNNLFKSKSFLVNFLKTEILNNENLNLDAFIISKKILPFHDLTDLNMKFKIEEGLIDVDDTKFSWFNYLDFKISNSLIYVNNNNLILDGKFVIDVKNFYEIYKFFQTPRNHRKEINKIEFNFNYNFDQEVVKFKTIQINGVINENISKILNQFSSKKSKIENRIHFKNLMNKVIKSYAG